MRKEPKYLYLTISLLTAVVLMTSSSPLSLLSILGVITSALSVMVTAYTLTKRRRQLLLAALLAALALLPFAWFTLHPQALGHRFAIRIYTLDLVFWLLFTFYTRLMVFRGIMIARRIHGNEIYGAIYL